MFLSSSAIQTRWAKGQKALAKKVRWVGTLGWWRRTVRWAGPEARYDDDEREEVVVAPWVVLVVEMREGSILD